MGQSIPFACQDWANTKAAYRFFPTITSANKTQGGHFQATSERFASSEGPMLILQDTTMFSYQRERPERIGFIGKSGTRKIDGRSKPLTQCGILMHSSLAVTTEGVPLGLASRLMPRR